MNLKDMDKAIVKILSAGDEESLEEKINLYLEENPDKVLDRIQLQQIEYHARTGSVDFGLIVILTMRIKNQ